MGGLWVQGQPGKKLAKPYLKGHVGVVVMPTVSATQENLGLGLALVKKHETLSER
jgi:hypothetical protein